MFCWPALPARFDKKGSSNAKPYSLLFPGFPGAALPLAACAAFCFRRTVCVLQLFVSIHSFCTSPLQKKVYSSQKQKHLIFTLLGASHFQKARERRKEATLFLLLYIFLKCKVSKQKIISLQSQSSNESTQSSIPFPPTTLALCC